jgi:2-oxoglutarate ferredoxin oxidoreductase subunit delta
MSNKVAFDEERCKGCEICVSVCPRGILYMADRRNDRGYRPAAVRDMERCTGCAVCAQMCPDLAIEVWRGGARETAKRREVSHNG